jgi:hypothetical protein
MEFDPLHGLEELVTVTGTGAGAGFETVVPPVLPELPDVLAVLPLPA